MVLKSHTGLRDWLIQRITALIIGVYTLFIVGYFIQNQPLYFAQWHQLFDSAWLKISTMVVLLAILWHAWIGLWTVITDYIKNPGLRLVMQSLVIIILLTYVLWGVEILV